MAKPQPAGGFLGGTSLTQEPAPPPESPEFGPDKAFKEAAEQGIPEIRGLGLMPGEEEEPTFDLPATRRRRTPGRTKVDFYIPTKQARLVDDMCEYVRHHFGVKKGEAQEVILAYGTNNKVEIMRHFRHEAEEDE